VTRATAFWVDSPGIGTLRAEDLRAPGDGEVLVRTLFTGISRGTESVVFRGEVPAGERDRIFDRFHRATDEPGGAGLGLAIADAIVRGTGGRWEIGDAPGGGARMAASWTRTGGGAYAARSLEQSVELGGDQDAAV